MWQLVVAGHRRAPVAAAEADAGTTRALLIMIAVLVLCAAALPRVGFTLTSFALVLIAARLMGLGGWWRPALLALGVTVVSRLLFGVRLGVPLP